MDWDNARVFLAIYRNGTLRGAPLLQIDQATAGRRLAALERSLDARLFLRTPAGYVPTAAGELAFAAAERMEQAADQLQRQMQGWIIACRASCAWPPRKPSAATS